MQVIETNLAGVLIIEPRVFPDTRGYFFETFQSQRYAEHGMALDFVQDNHSRSPRGVLRGLHYQLPHSQGKLVWVTRGQVYDVAVDIRVGSPQFGQSTAVVLDADNHRQLYVPPGFAHGFCVLSTEADFFYKCTDYYAPQAEQGILWSDPALGIEWPLDTPILSDKDQDYVCLADIPEHALPHYETST